MKRMFVIAAALLVPAALALPAAAQSPAKVPGNTTVHPVAAGQPLYLNIQQPQAGSGFTPAPMPNLDIASPTPAPKAGPEFSGSLFATHDGTGPNSGYTSGSAYSTDLERRSHGVGNSFAPTLSLKIPFVYANANRLQ